MHILFADDSRAAALPVIFYLEKSGHRVTYVQNGRLAVEAYRQEVPDLILMDVVMPEMDGVEATRQIKAISGSRWVPLMIMTGLSAKEEIVSTLDAGADDYLIKPIIFEVLEARMRSMQRIATLQSSLFGILDNAFEAIITLDSHAVIHSFNKTAEKIFGYGAAEVIGQPANRLIPGSCIGSLDRFFEAYRAGDKGDILGKERKVQGLRRSGETFPMCLALTEVERGQGGLFIAMVRDVSEEEAARRKIEFLAHHDTLTGLPNRAHFNEVIDGLFSAPEGGAVHALAFIDLDGFKPINDTLQHEAGDEALKIVADRLCAELGQESFVARLGGDEFVAIMPQVSDANQALTIGNRLVAAISQPMTLRGTVCRLGASIGVALYPIHGNTPNELLTAADNAMYQAKRTGKSRTCVAPISAPVSP